MKTVSYRAVFSWCSNSSKFVTNNSDNTRCCLRLLKWNQNRLNRDGTLFFTRGGCVSCLRGCLGARLLPQSYQYPNLSEGADRLGGHLRGDKDWVPLQWRNQIWQNLEKVSGKRCSECVPSHHHTAFRSAAKRAILKCHTLWLAKLQDMQCLQTTTSEKKWRTESGLESRSFCYSLLGDSAKLVCQSECAL